MKRILLTIIVALPLMAQPAKEEHITKLVMLKYGDPSSVAAMISQFGVRTVPNNQLKAMTITGAPADIAAAEAALRILDVAPKTIELVVNFVVGTDQANVAGSVVIPPPAEIRDVIAQLKNTFAFKDYRMLDTLTLRTRTGSSAETSGILGAGTTPRLSTFSVHNVTVGDDGTVRIDRMHAGVRIPIGQRTTDTKSGTRTSPEYLNTGIDQDVDIKDGQKVVVGRSSLEGPEKALFLILTAKVL